MAIAALALGIGMEISRPIEAAEASLRAVAAPAVWTEMVRANIRISRLSAHQKCRTAVLKLIAMQCLITRWWPAPLPFYCQRCSCEAVQAGTRVRASLPLLDCRQGCPRQR